MNETNKWKWLELRDLEKYGDLNIDKDMYRKVEVQDCLGKYILMGKTKTKARWHYKNDRRKDTGTKSDTTTPTEMGKRDFRNKVMLT